MNPKATSFFSLSSLNYKTPLQPPKPFSHQRANKKTLSKFSSNKHLFSSSFNSNSTTNNRRIGAMYQKHLWMIGGSKPPVPSPWSRLQDKLFEQALVLYPDDTPDRWEEIAGQVPGKTSWEVREHYEALIYDVMEIDSGRVQLPSYADDSSSFRSNWESECSQISFGSTKTTKQSETERKKGVPWTEEEHKLFLIGLKKYGKGDWRSISRNAVQSRTPTQVASHAQKYYLRLNSEKKEKKRSSIHDITTVENNSVSQPNNQGQDGQSGILDQTGATGSYPGQRGGYPVYQHQFNFPM